MFPAMSFSAPSPGSGIEARRNLYRHILQRTQTDVWRSAKVDSVTGDPIKGAKFQIWYASNHTDTGELNDLGVHFTQAEKSFSL